MTDEMIVDLYFERDERAIEETSQKFGAYCTKISMNILGDIADSEECVNDTYLQAWNSIPPNRPEGLAAYLGRITRNLSINRYRAKYADKRAASQFGVSLDELDDCIPDADTLDRNLSSKELGALISSFLREQTASMRKVFVLRYFHGESVTDIAIRMGYSESKVKSILHRMRGKLKLRLESEGVAI